MSDISFLDDRWYDLEDLPNEEWKDIKGFENIYQVSNYGRVKRLKTFLSYPIYMPSFDTFFTGHTVTKEKILKQHLNQSGYPVVKISKPGLEKRKLVQVHILVAMSFIPNPNNYPIINHIDGNKANSKVSNLEWCTYQYNIQHAINTGLMKVEKAVLQFDLDGNFITEYKSITEAGKTLNISANSIGDCCRGRIKTSGGFLWKFKEI